MTAGFVLSFDFELAWGSRQSRAGARFSEAAAVVDALAILSKYDLRATWATVGALMLQSDDVVDGSLAEKLFADAGCQQAALGDARFPEPREATAGGYYAPRLIDRILACPTPQEIGSHSFTHALLGSESVSEERARAELKLSAHLARRWGIELQSFVFPRNVIGRLPLLREAGYRCYRGANCEWYWFGNASGVYARKWLRYPAWVLRYLDECFCLPPPLPDARYRQGIWEIPHSMFLPGFSGVSRWITTRQRVWRAVRGLKRAAQPERLFSLWTHPVNFLTATEPMLWGLEEMCRTAARLRDGGQLRVFTMGELAAALDKKRTPARHDVV